MWPPPSSTLFPYTTLFRSVRGITMAIRQYRPTSAGTRFRSVANFDEITRSEPEKSLLEPLRKSGGRNNKGDRKSTRLNSSHVEISYAVFCLKKKKKKTITH